MTVGELKDILSKIEDTSMEIISSGSYDPSINGYYMDKEEGKSVLVLTRLSVQPKVS